MKIGVDDDTLAVIDDYKRVFNLPSREEALRMIVSGFAHPPDHETLHALLGDVKSTDPALKGRGL